MNFFKRKPHSLYTRPDVRVTFTPPTVEDWLCCWKPCEIVIKPEWLRRPEIIELIIKEMETTLDSIPQKYSAKEQI